MIQHPIIKDLAARKTSKSYDATKRVSQENMEIIYEALRLTASSINSQPWKFIVIESDQAKKRLESTFTDNNIYNRQHVSHGSHVILLAHNPKYTLEDYEKVVDTDIANGRGKTSDKERALSKFAFAESKTDVSGHNGNWTKAQVYIVLGNALHLLARLKIDGTPMEGINSKLIGDVFKEELNGFECEVALVIGYHHPDDINSQLPKSRLASQEVLQIL